MTDKQKKAIAFWATGPGTKTAPGMWLKFASDAMQENSMHLEKILLLRSVLAMTLADTEIAAMDSKYTLLGEAPFYERQYHSHFYADPQSSQLSFGARCYRRRGRRFP